jgi:hypothetical protein
MQVIGFGVAKLSAFGNQSRRQAEEPDKPTNLQTNKPAAYHWFVGLLVCRLQALSPGRP